MGNAKKLMDVDYAYQLYRDDIERQFHFHHYSSGKITYKKQYKHLYYEWEFITQND